MRTRLVEHYAELHARTRYGVSSERPDVVRAVQRVIDLSDPPILDILDYGCGQSRLHELLRGGADIVRYDPAIPGIDKKPEGRVFDLVLCTDVLEHIPEDELDLLLKDVAASGRKVFFIIALFEHNLKLGDGSHVHCTVKPAAWWESRLASVLGPTLHSREVKRHLHVTCGEAPPPF